MVEEIKNNLLKTYNTVKLVIAAKELSMEMDNGDEYDCDYDIPLLQINYRDLADGENKNLVSPLLQVRVRKFKDYEEELVIVMTSNGATKKVENIEEDLKSAAEMVEKATEDFLLEFPDVVYTYKWADFTLTE